MRRVGIVAGWMACAGCFNPSGGGSEATSEVATTADGTAATTTTTSTPTDGTSTMVATTTTTTALTTSETAGESTTDTGSTAECPGGCTSTTTDAETGTTTETDGEFEVVLAGIVPVSGPWGLAAANSTPDGFQDLYVTSLKMEVLFAIDGATLVATPTALPGTARALAVAEVNGFGSEDVAVAVVSPIPALVLMIGTGVAAQPLVMADSEALSNCADAASISLADLNGDTRLDAVVACTTSSVVYVAPGDLDTTFSAPVAHGVGLAPVEVTLAPLVGSPGVDLIAVGSESLNVFAGTGALNPAFSGVAMPSFMGVLGPRGLTVGEFNGDGLPDVLVTQFSPNECSVAIGVDLGLMTPAPVACGADTRHALLVDVTGDGLADLVTIHGPDAVGTLTVARGGGDGTFSEAYSGPTGAGPQRVAAVDFSGDGVMDLAVSAYAGDAVYMYRVDP
jgi:hypothetical protein